MTEVNDCLLKEYCLLKSSSFHAGICSLCVLVYVRSWRRATKNYNLLPETPKNEPKLSLFLYVILPILYRLVNSIIFTGYTCQETFDTFGMCKHSGELNCKYS